jgi:formate hydrogenlyase transcriptional activator
MAVDSGRPPTSGSSTPPSRSLADEVASRLESYRELIEHARVIVWRADARTFQFTFVSNYAETLLGYPLLRWTSEPAFWQDHIHPDDRKRTVALCTQATQEKRRHELEYRMMAADGRAIWLRDVVSVGTENDQPTELIGAMMEITELKKAETALRHNEEYLRKVINTIPQQIWSGPADGTLDFYNVRLLVESGLTLEELRGDGWQQAIHPEHRDRVLNAWHESIANGTPYEQQQRQKTASGQYRWFLCRGVPLHDERGDIVSWFGSNTDIDDQKRSEDELRLAKRQLQQQHDRLRLLLDFNYQFISKLDLIDFLDAVLDGLCGLDRWEWGSILLPVPHSAELRVYRSRGTELLTEGTTIPLEGTLAGQVYRSGQTIAFCAGDFPPLSQEYSWTQEAVGANRAGCVLPLVHNEHMLGVLFLMTRTEQASDNSELGFLEELAKLVGAALNNSLRFDQMNASHTKIVNEKKCIEDDIRREGGFEEIIRESAALNNVLQLVNAVAATDSAVLLLGESGTGKELVARALHDRSLRSDQAFIKIDCAAIPGALIESELFGHEKGAFTGAIAQRMGRFEIADGGTLFLDEVGDIPLELQAKLLRVLQDQAFERVGSNRTRHVNVRVVAATNRDLERKVEEGKFREDLYYRLKVFPIVIPPLRERPEDIPPLVRHYVDKYAKRFGKAPPSIPSGVMAALMRYSWPGNVRELQHFIERSVVISPGKVLRAPVAELERITRRRRIRGEQSSTGRLRTLEEMEREFILQALEESDWVIGGPQGAAVRLGVKRTTLASRMEKLGISRHK